MCITLMRQCWQPPQCFPPEEHKSILKHPDISGMARELFGYYYYDKK